MNIRCPECRTVFRVDPARIPPAGIRARCSRCSSTFHVSREEPQPEPRRTGATPGGEAERPSTADDAGGIPSPADIVRTAAGAAADAARTVVSGVAAAAQAIRDVAPAPAEREEGATPRGRERTEPGFGTEPSHDRERAEPGFHDEPAAGPASPVEPPRPRHVEPPAFPAAEVRPEEARPEAGAPSAGPQVDPAHRQEREAARPPLADRPGAAREQQPSGSDERQAGAGAARTAAPDAPRPPLFGTRDPDARAQRIARALISDIVAYHPQRREEALAAGTLRTDFREEIMKSWEEYVAQVGLETARGTPHFRNALNQILARGQQVF
jgi:predicted Zn finger-like uncharacterized protein